MGKSLKEEMRSRESRMLAGILLVVPFLTSNAPGIPTIRCDTISGAGLRTPAFILSCR
jgi:hypothetical protein